MSSAAWRRGGPPLVIGHRGASALEVENTMAAFARAAAEGADGVELDVRLTADGEVVVFHDDDLWRLGGRRMRIDALSAAELAGVALRDGHSIPTLDQVLAGFPALLVNVEIKSPGPRHVAPLVDRVIERVRRGAPERIVISSFDPWAIALVRRRAPELRTGLLFHQGQAAPLRRASLAPLLQPFALHPDRRLVTAARARAWTARYAVHVWTVDDEAELRLLAGLGVAAVITNDPARARRALAG